MGIANHVVMRKKKKKDWARVQSLVVSLMCEAPHWPSYHLPWAALQTHCPCSLGWLAASGVSSSFSWKSISDRTHAHAAATQERKTRKFGNVPWLTPFWTSLCCPALPCFVRGLCSLKQVLVWLSTLVLSVGAFFNHYNKGDSSKANYWIYKAPKNTESSCCNKGDCSGAKHWIYKAPQSIESTFV